MKAKLAVLGDAQLIEGFQLAGVEDTHATTDAEFQTQLEKLLEQTQYGVVVVNERMLRTIDWRLKKKLDNLAYPVIIPVPAPGERSEAGDEIRALIKRALGFDLGAK